MVVAAFNQEKALVGAFSVIMNLRMELFEALHQTRLTLSDTSPDICPPVLGCSFSGNNVQSNNDNIQTINISTQRAGQLVIHLFFGAVSPPVLLFCSQVFI